MWLNIIFKESNREAKHFNFEVGNLLTFSVGEKKVSEFHNSSNEMMRVKKTQ